MTIKHMDHTIKYQQNEKQTLEHTIKYQQSDKAHATHIKISTKR